MTPDQFCEKHRINMEGREELQALLAARAARVEHEIRTAALPEKYYPKAEAPAPVEAPPLEALKETVAGVGG